MLLYLFFFLGSRMCNRTTRRENIASDLQVIDEKIF